MQVISKLAGESKSSHRLQILQEGNDDLLLDATLSSLSKELEAIAERTHLIEGCEDSSHLIET